MKNKLYPVIILAAALGLSGCGTVAFNPTESSIFAKKDGSIVSADIEEFAEDKYSIDELTAYVEEAVSTYNKAHDAEEKAYAEKNEVLPIAIQSIKAAEDKASLFLTYQSAEDYVTFVGTAGLEDGISAMEIYSINEKVPEAEFFKLSSGEAADQEKIQKLSNSTVLMIDGPATIAVEGSPVYATEGVTADRNIVTTPSGKVSYVVFK